MTKIIFFGDFFLGDGSPTPAFSADLLGLIKEHDLACVNLEGSICRSPSQYGKVGPRLKLKQTAPTFLEDSGFSVISLANNHSMDNGEEDLKSTSSLFKRSHICGIGSGSGAYEAKVVGSKGKKIGFLAASERHYGSASSDTDYGYAWINHPRFHYFIAEAKKRCDVLFIYAHCGLEDMDIPLPQWRDNLKSMIEHGADAVVSTHTHFNQGMEIHRGKPVFYSLGNFFFEHSMEQAEYNSGHCVSFEVHGDNSLSWKRTGHQVSPDNSVSLSDLESKLSSLDAKITDPDYMDDIDNICLSSWSEIYEPYFRSSLNGIGANPWQNIKLVIKKILGKTRTDHAKLLHCIMVESNRYVAEIALRKLSKLK